MLTYIELLEAYVAEGVDFHPAEVQYDSDGSAYYGWPTDSERKVEKECWYCDGSGKDIQDKNDPCERCGGKGKTMEIEYDFPNLRLGYMNRHILSQITQQGDSDHGWIPPEDIADVKRKLLRLMNTSQADELSRPPSAEGGDTFVDRTGEIPEIRRRAQMIDGGLSSAQIHQYAAKMLEVLDWAQNKGIGVAWA